MLHKKYLQLCYQHDKCSSFLSSFVNLQCLLRSFFVQASIAYVPEFSGKVKKKILEYTVDFFFFFFLEVVNIAKIWSVFDKKIQFTSYFCAKVSKYYTRFFQCTVLLVVLFVCLAELHLECQSSCVSVKMLSQQTAGISHIETKPVCLVLLFCTHCTGYQTGLYLYGETRLISEAQWHCFILFLLSRPLPFKNVFIHGASVTKLHYNLP